MTEINYAELEKRMFEGPITIQEARRMGSTHKAYGWASKPLGASSGWTEDHVVAYREGYAA